MATAIKTSAGKETASQTVARAKSMLAQTKSQGSKAYKGSSYEKAYNESVIASKDLQPTPKITLPPPVTPTAPDIAANFSGLANSEFGVTTDGKSLSVTPPTEDKYGGATAAQDAYMKELKGMQDEAPTGAEIQRKLERDTQFRQKQQEVNNFSAQLNTIVANRDANVLRTEGQGRGIPEAIIGGQQAQINREAAIAALPVQAQLAAAQGNLALAQDHINTWGKILMDDATNKYNQKKELLTSARDFAMGIEFKKIEELEKKNERTYQETQTFNKAKTTALQNALGQNAPSSVVNAIKMATTADEVAIAAGQYNGDILARRAQEASIAASYASTAKNKAELAVIQAKQKQIEDAIKSGTVVLDEEQQKTAMSLSKQFEDESKTFKVQTSAYNQILASAADSSAAGDLSLIFGYMKMLDPNSVVRETEFANAENAAGVPERIRAQFNKVQSGERLTDPTRTDFVDRAAKVYGAALDQQVDLEDTFSQQGTDVYGLPPKAVDLIIRDIRAQGAVSDVVFGLTLNNLSDTQLLNLSQSGLLTTTPVR